MASIADTRRLRQMVFGRHWHRSRVSMQLDHSRLVLETQSIVEPLTLFHCPAHSNHALAAMIGLLGRDRDGRLAVERVG